MKRVLCTTLFSICMLTLFAQQHPDAGQLLNLDMPRLDMINNALQRGQNAGNLLKPTLIKQRVIAQVRTSFGTNDSTIFKYSGIKGSNYSYNRIGWGYNSRFKADYDPLLQDIGESQTINMLADSIIQHGDGALNYFCVGYYRGDRKMDSFLYANVLPVPLGSKDYLSFYPNGYLKEHMITNSNDGLNYYTTYTRKLIYNATYTQIISDSTFTSQALTPYKAISYVYNSEGLPDTVITRELGTTPFANPQMNVYTYTPTGKIQNIFSFSDHLANNHFVLSHTDSFFYANNSDWFTYWRGNTYNPAGQLVASGRMIQYPGGNGSFPDSFKLATLTTGNTWDDPLAGYYTHNAYGNPIALELRAGSNPDITFMKFYYEEFDDLSIQDKYSSRSLKVFPNPIGKKLSLVWDEAGTVEDVRFRIVNATGREMFRSKMKLRKGLHTVSLPELPCGHYLVLVHTESGATYHCKVLKN